MSLSALGIVLFAAFLHAGWNALLKATTDRAAILAAVAGAHVAIGVGMIAWYAPPAIASWPMLLTSTVVHYGYYLLLFQAYKHGDLSQVYPISRGMAPALVSLGAVLLIDETLPAWGCFGLGLVSFGICLLALQGGAIKARPQTFVIALALGSLIAVYSVADGIGVRWSTSPFGYIGWLFVLEAPVPLVIVGSRWRNGGRFDRRVIVAGLIGGGCAAVAYGLVLYVKTFAPLGAVSAVRESSVIIAALIGVVVFGERPWRGRLIAAGFVAVGIVFLALSK